MSPPRARCGPVCVWKWQEHFLHDGPSAMCRAMCRCVSGSNSHRRKVDTCFSISEVHSSSFSQDWPAPRVAISPHKRTHSCTPQCGFWRELPCGLAKMRWREKLGFVTRHICTHAGPHRSAFSTLGLPTLALGDLHECTHATVLRAKTSMFFFTQECNFKKKRGGRRLALRMQFSAAYRR